MASRTTGTTATKQSEQRQAEQPNDGDKATNRTAEWPTVTDGERNNADGDN